ncbi:hypothetical protein MTO96_027109 [Rhipicephalus appendiculatus]
MLLVAFVAAVLAFQLYNRRAAALQRMSKLGPRYRVPRLKTSTPTTDMQVQLRRRPLVQTPPEPEETLAGVRTRAATGPPCIEDTYPSTTIEERDKRTACGRRGRRLRCNYAAENGVDFVVHENFIASDDCPPAYADNVTLVTHATYGFLRHVEGLCDRWQGPLSVAVFAPGTDFDGALAWIDFLRRCGRRPSHSGAASTGDLALVKLHGRPRESLVLICPPPPLEDASSFRRSRKVPYPANVLRNVARKLAPTHYVLVQNVRLYPSLDIVPRFMSLVAEQRRTRSFRSDGHEVYVLPVFAMTSRADGPEVGQQAPGNMRQLRESLRSGTVVPLNDSSHGGPLWSKSFYSAIVNDVLAWEPVFVGTRDDDPPYSGALTWEGGHERVPQGYVMCLEDYDFHIVEGAFVVRVPRQTSGEGAVVRTSNGDPSLRNEFSFRRVMDSIGIRIIRYPTKLRERC